MATYRAGQLLYLVGDKSGIKCRVERGGKSCTTVPGGDSKTLSGRKWRSASAWLSNPFERLANPFRF